MDSVSQKLLNQVNFIRKITQSLASVPLETIARSQILIRFKLNIIQLSTLTFTAKQLKLLYWVWFGLLFTTQIFLIHNEYRRS